MGSEASAGRAAVSSRVATHATAPTIASIASRTGATSASIAADAADAAAATITTVRPSPPRLRARASAARGAPPRGGGAVPRAAWAPRPRRPLGSARPPAPSGGGHDLMTHPMTHPPP